MIKIYNITSGARRRDLRMRESFTL